MDIAIASVIGLTSLGGLFHFGQLIVREGIHQREIEGAQTFSPDNLVKHLNKMAESPEHKKATQDNNEYKVKCFVQGLVQCNTPVKSKLNKTTNLIHSVYYKEDMYSNNFHFAGYIPPVDDKPDAEVRAPLIFQLVDPLTNTPCQIHRSLEIKANYALEKIDEKKQDHQLNFFEKILAYIGMVAQIFNFATRNIISCRGIKIGWTEKEFGIRVGSLLTVFGEVVFNSKDKSIKMNSPLYYLKEKSNILKEFKGKLAQRALRFSILALSFGLSSIYVFLRARAYYQRYHSRRLHEETDQHKQIQTLILEKDYKCIVCAERPRSVILKPCLHFSLCGVCYHQIPDKSCPVCKSEIKEAVEVYFS